MNKKHKIITKISGVLLSTGLYLLSAKSAFALTLGVCLPSAKGGPEVCTVTGYSQYIRSFYGFTITLGASLAGLMIISSGYIYLTSQGDTTKLNKAKEIFTGSFLGFILLLSVSAILRWIGLPAFK